jgi:hypothetical protein
MENERKIKTEERGKRRNRSKRGKREEKSNDKHLNKLI